MRFVYEQSGCGTDEGNDTEEAILAEIAIQAYFFAMRLCEITSTPTPDRTKITRLSGITFREHKNREMNHKPEDL
jgi:hypothetical protein